MGHSAAQPGSSCQPPLAALTGHADTDLLNRYESCQAPICHALPHAFDIFEDQYRSEEGIFAVLAHLGGAGIYRTHEVPLIRSVLDAMHVLKD